MRSPSDQCSLGLARHNLQYIYNLEPFQCGLRRTVAFPRSYWYYVGRRRQAEQKGARVR